MREGWYQFKTEEEAEKLVMKIGLPHYSDVKWEGPGWYYCFTDQRYFRGGAWDIYGVVISAAERLNRINEQIRELWSERREAQNRRST